MDVGVQSLPTTTVNQRDSHIFTGNLAEINDNGSVGQGQVAEDIDGNQRKWSRTRIVRTKPYMGFRYPFPSFPAIYKTQVISLQISPNDPSMLSHAVQESHTPLEAHRQSRGSWTANMHLSRPPKTGNPQSRMQQEWQAKDPQAFGNTSLNCLNPTDFQLLHVLSRATPPKRSYFPSKSKTCVPFTRGSTVFVQNHILHQHLKSVPMLERQLLHNSNQAYHPTMISRIPLQDISKLATPQLYNTSHGDQIWKSPRYPQVSPGNGSSGSLMMILSKKGMLHCHLNEK